MKPEKLQKSLGMRPPAEKELTQDERDLIDQLLDMYAENPSNRNKYRHSMYYVALELKNGRSPIQEGE